jgi:hypothetical protein
MNLFAFIHDIIDDHRKIADKFCLEHRLAFFQRFCEWKVILMDDGGDLRWQPRYGWGVEMRNWVRSHLEEQMKDSVASRAIIGCLLAEWEANDEDEEAMSNMLTILSIDFPDGPIAKKEKEANPDHACGICGCPWGWKVAGRSCPMCGHAKEA